MLKNGFGSHLSGIARMTPRQCKIAAADGLEISLTHYRQEGESPDRVAIVLGATGVVQDRYAAFARFLAEDGWHALTFDYRGIGRSAVSSAHREKVSMQAWGERDLTAVLQWAEAELRPKQLVVVAHSIGGQIIPLARNHARIQAVLALAVQKGYWRLWDAPNKYLVYGFFRFYIPICLKLFKHVPLSVVGLHRLEREAARDYARWTLRLDYRSAAGDSLNERFSEFRAPILSLSFEDDAKYAPKRAVDFLMKHYYVRAPVLRCHVVPRRFGIRTLGHSGFFDPHRCPRSFWEDASGWLQHASSQGGPDGYRFKCLPDVQPLHEKKPLELSGDGFDTSVRDGAGRLESA